MNHQLVYEQQPDQFTKDLTECIELLQQITGKKVVTYRAPGFSVSEKSKWIFGILAAHGIQNDCSVFPAKRNHGGLEHFPSTKPCVLSMRGIQLREFPMSPATFA